MDLEILESYSYRFLDFDGLWTSGSGVFSRRP